MANARRDEKVVGCESIACKPRVMFSIVREFVSVVAAARAVPRAASMADEPEVRAQAERRTALLRTDAPACLFLHSQHPASAPCKLRTSCLTRHKQQPSEQSCAATKTAKQSLKVQLGLAQLRPGL